MKIILSVIAVCLVMITYKQYSSTAYAQYNGCDEDRIISRILYCIDGSSISGGSLTTFCDR